MEADEYLIRTFKENKDWSKSTMKKKYEEKNDTEILALTTN